MKTTDDGPVTDKAPQTAQDAPVSSGATDLAADIADGPSAPALADTHADLPTGGELGGAAIDHKLETWVRGHIANGPIARDVNCWNALMRALPLLSAALKEGTD